MNKIVKEIEQKLKAKMPFRWKVQSVSKYKPSATCVAYIDARDAMDRLDEVVGIDNWQDEYMMIGNILYCTLSIRFPGIWIHKTDCGVESNVEKEKGQASDAFKRACVKWGIGRFLYSLDVKYINTSEKKEGNNHPYPVDSSNKRIWDLTKHFASNPKTTKKKSTPKPKPKEETLKELRNKEIQELFNKNKVKLDDDHVKSIVEKIKGSGVESIEEMSRRQFSELLEAIEFDLK